MIYIKTRMKKIPETCKTCAYKQIIGGWGDWNLCCIIQHPTPKEKENGMVFIFGYLCYEDTDACDAYKSKEVRQC